jgi:hypothetical protein
MIAKHAVEEWYSTLIVSDPNGERIGAIWRRVYWLTPTNDRHATERRNHRQVIRMGNTTNALFDPKIIFSRQVPALLQVGHHLREEGREEFLKVARFGLTNAETKNNFDREYCKILLTLHPVAPVEPPPEDSRAGDMHGRDGLGVVVRHAAPGSWHGVQRSAVVCFEARVRAAGAAALEDGRKASGE